MRSKIYKHALMLSALLATVISAWAQTAPVPPPPPATPVQTNVNVDLNKLSQDLANLNIAITPHLAKLDKNITTTINKVMTNVDGKISQSISILSSQLSSINCNVDVNTDDTDYGDLEELTKTYSKSYPADANDLLSINNRYGKVTVNTWAKNEFKVDVLIKVATNKDGHAKKMLDDVTIEDSKQGSTVWFKTRFAGDQGTGSWSFGGKKTVRIMEINYTIHMPAKNALTVTNKYGSTELPDLYGRVVVNSSYGNLLAKNLSNPANDINVRYGSANIEGLSGCDLKVAYGSLNLNESDKVNTSVSYGSAKIGNVKNSGVINVKYSGELNIENIDKNMKNLVVNSSYSGIKVGLPQALNLDFDVTVHYGSFNYGTAVNVISNNTSNEKGWKPTKNYKGSVGKGNSDKVIVIKSTYGNVDFK